MKKILKSIALALVIAFASVNTSQAFAATNKQVKHEITVDEAIRIIEDNYLSLDSDGTFKIDSKAKEVIPEDIYNSLNEGMKNVNIEIDNNNLEVFESFQGYEVKPVDELNSEIRVYSSRAYNEPIINNYTFFWWGYIAEANRVATNIFINELENLIYVAGTAGAVGAYFTVGATVLLSAAAGVGAYALITQAKNSLEITPDGTTIYAYGSPSKGQVYKVTQLYN